MTVFDLLVHPVVVGLVVIVVASGMMGLFSSKQHFPVEGRVSEQLRLDLVTS